MKGYVVVKTTTETWSMWTSYRARVDEEEASVFSRMERGSGNQPSIGASSDLGFPGYSEGE